MFYLSRPIHALNERVTYYPHLKYCTCLHINILFKLVFGKHEYSSHPTLVSFRAPLTLTSISMRHREIGLGGECILCRSRSAHLYCSTYAQYSARSNRWQWQPCFDMFSIAIYCWWYFSSMWTDLLLGAHVVAPVGLCKWDLQLNWFRRRFDCLRSSITLGKSFTYLCVQDTIITFKIRCWKFKALL